MKHIIFLCGLLVLLIAGCSQKSNKNSNDSSKHSHEEVTIQLTAYSDEFELFVETDAFVSGETATVLAHITYLSDFKPLEGASIVAKLSVDGFEVKQNIDKAKRKGIYEFRIKPEKIGKGELVFDIHKDGEEYQIAVDDIIVFSDSHEASHSTASLDLSKTNTVVYTKEQSWKVTFASDLPRVEPFGQLIKTVGLLQSSQTDELLVSAISNGIVSIEANNLLSGKKVKSGETLVFVSANDLVDNNSQVRYNEAKNNYINAKSDFERIEVLAKEKIVSEKDFLLAKNKLDNAKLIYDNLSKSYSSQGQTLRSPFDGYIKEIFVRNGEFVETGQPIFSVEKGKTLLIEAQIQQKYAPLVSKIETVNIYFPSIDKVYSLEDLNGKIVSIGKTTNKSNYLLPLHMQIDNVDNFVNGSFVEVFIKVISNNKAITLPNTALLEEQGSYFVFVQLTPELFEKKEIFPGSTDGIRTEILGGIAYDERVVTKGGILIKLAQATGSLDAHSGHVH